MHDLAQNQIWTAIVMLAANRIACLQLLALADSQACPWEPKVLR